MSSFFLFFPLKILATSVVQPKEFTAESRSTQRDPDYFVWFVFLVVPQFLCVLRASAVNVQS